MPKARYFGPKPDRVKDRLKSLFWLAQNKKKSGRARPWSKKNCQNRGGPGQNDLLYVQSYADGTQGNKINFDVKQEIKLAYVISTEKL